MSPSIAFIMKQHSVLFYTVSINGEFREFLMTDARDGSSRTIRQFHFTAWPEETEVPRQADYFIDLIGQVTRNL